MSQERAFFYRRNNETRGPFSAQAIRQLARCGQLLPTDLIASSLGKRWIVASRIRDLFVTTPASGCPTAGDHQRADSPGSAVLKTKLPTDAGLREPGPRPPERMAHADNTGWLPGLAQACFTEAKLASEITWTHAKAMFVRGRLPADPVQRRRLLIGYAVLGIVVGNLMFSLGRVISPWGNGQHDIARAMRDAATQQQKMQHQLEDDQKRRERQQREESQKRLALMRDAVARGDGLRESGQLHEAVAAYREAFAIDPESIYAFHGKGLVSMLLQQWSDAIEFFGEAIDVNDQFAAAYLNRARCYIKLQEFDKAIDDLSEAIQIDPTSGEFYSYRAHAYRENEQTDEALRDIESAIRLNTPLAEPYFGRAMIRMKKEDDLASAISDFDEAIRRDPEWVLAYFMRATAHSQQQSYQEALSDFGTALRIDPSLIDAYYGRAFVASKLGKDEQSVADWTSLLRRSPDAQANELIRIFMARGEALLRLKRYAEANADFSRAIEHDDEHLVAYQQRAKARQAMNDPSAKADLLKIEQLNRAMEEQSWVDSAPAQWPAYAYSTGGYDYAGQADLYRRQAMAHAQEQADRSMRDYMSRTAGQLGAIGLQWVPVQQ